MYDWLYSRDVRTQRRGLDRVISWRSRCKLPVAVECTAAFIDSQLQDITTDARSAYALAIVRFINGITDGQQTTVYARSVAGIASEMGLPQWLVDLRHDSTHKILPSIELLRKGCSEALKWLEINYWKAHVDASQQDDESEKHQEDKVASTLQDYIRCQLKIKRIGNTPRKVAARESILNHLVNEVSRLSDHNQTLIELLISIFVTHQYNDGESDVCENGDDDQSVELTTSMVDMWQPLVQHLHTRVVGFVSRLFVHLFKALTLSQTNNHVKNLMCSHVVSLVKCFSQSDEGDRVFDVSLMLHVVNLCLHYPSMYSGKILECVMQCVSEQEAMQQLTEWIDKAKTLVDIYSGCKNDKMSETDGEIRGEVREETEYKEWTVEDIQKKIDKNHDTDMSSTWTRCMDRFAWEMCPIGLAPQQTMTCTMFTHTAEHDHDDIPPPIDTENETHVDINDASDAADMMINNDLSEECTEVTYKCPTEWTDVQLTDLQQQIVLF